MLGPFVCPAGRLRELDRYVSALFAEGPPLALSVLALSGFAVWSAQQPKPPADDPAAEEAKEKAVAERFRQVLETNPRRGTALDRLYGYHVERGSLDTFIQQFADRAKKDSKDGSAWMILGLLVLVAFRPPRGLAPPPRDGSPPPRGGSPPACGLAPPPRDTSPPPGGGSRG